MPGSGVIVAEVNFLFRYRARTRRAGSGLFSFHLTDLLWARPFATFKDWLPHLGSLPARKGFSKILKYHNKQKIKIKI